MLLGRMPFAPKTETSMTATNNFSTVKELLVAQSASIAEQWQNAIRQSSYLPQRPSMLAAFFEKLVAHSIEALVTPDATEREKRAIKVGEKLGSLRHLQPEALAATQKVLWKLLTAEMSPELLWSMHEPLTEVMAGISVGFFRAARHEMLLAQENLHHAVRSALFASEEKFRQLTEIASVLIFIFQGTRFRYVNSWFKFATGYTEDEIRQMNFWDIVHPEHRQMVMQHGLARQIGEYAPPRYEVKIQRKDGRVLWVELSAAPIEFEGNDAILGTAFDITERVESEKRHKQLLAEVSAAEERQRALLRAIPDLVFRMDTNGKIIDYHTNSPELLFVPPEEFIGKSMDVVIPSPTGEKLHAATLMVAQTGERHEMAYSLEIGGKVYHFEAHFSAGRNEVLAAVRDVTASKLAVQSALRAERMAALGRLSAALAHELNNPLQAIQTNLDLILDFPLNEEEKEEYFHIIRNELKRVTELSQHILNFASPRPEAREPLVVPDVINRVLRLWRKQLEKNRVTVVTEFHASQPIIAAQNQLHQVFLNLILNAIDAIRSEKESGTIVIIVQKTEDKLLEIVFANDGPPIPDAALPHLFEPFFTTKATGNGLGLWTSYNIVQQYDGTLVAENAPGGRGALFRIQFPVADKL